MFVVAPISSYWRDFIANEEASASIEFVIIAPMLFWFVFSTFEIGWLMTQQTMLSRGLNMAVHDLRRGNIHPGFADQTPEEVAAQMQDEIKGRVCFHARILRNCFEQIFLELVVLDLQNTSNLSQTATCLDLDPDEPIVPAVNFSPGARDPNPSTMFIRACVLVDLLLPSFGISKNLSRDNTGRYQMIAYTAFANEPA